MLIVKKMLSMFACSGEGIHFYAAPPVEDICVAGLSASKTTKRYFLRVRRVALHQDQLSESASQFIGQGVR